MAVIVKRTGKDGTITYQTRIRLRGQPQQSATFSTRSKAKEWAQVTESAMREGRHFKTSESKKHTVGDLTACPIEEYAEAGGNRALSGSELSDIASEVRTVR
jgi:hypothetical protein